MQPLFEHRRRFAGYETRVLELEGEGAPLVLLHGYADSADTWRPLLDLLGRRDRRALAVDLPGFAAADPLRPGSVLPQLDRFAAAVASTVAAEAGAPPVLAGNSLGGSVALRAGERADLELAGIVPVAPAGLEMARWLSLIEGEPFLRGLLALPTPVPARVVREVVGRAYRLFAFHRGARVDPQVVDAFTAHHGDLSAVRRYLATGRALMAELADPFRLERIGCPVLVVWGERDRMVAVTGARRVAEALPDARIELIPECGHCPQIECADVLAGLLDDFPPAPVARAA